MKKYLVTVELTTVELKVSAKSKVDAKRKALDNLNKRNISTLIFKSWPRQKKEIYAEEIN